MRRFGLFCLSFLLLSQPYSAQPATLTVQNVSLGSTPDILAYNSGHFVPGSNTRDWWRYAGVHGARVFLTPGIIEASDDIAGRGDGVVDVTGFLSRRAALRANPLNTNYINWGYLTNRYKITAEHGANILEPYYTCASLRALGIEILVNIGASPGTFPITDTNDWAGKWELWQHYYAQAFYLGREFDVHRFQMYNEPDLSAGLTVADYVERLKLVSDAVQCALADLNPLYGKSLVPRLVAPVSAGNSTSDYNDWGRPIVTNRHVNFLGQTDPNFSLIHQYDYHEYNSTVSSFGNNLQTLHNSLTADMAPEARYPTSISEFNAHTAGVFDTLTDTLDTPAQFTRLGSISATLIRNSIRELYCFKLSQTLNTTTVKKNGTHFVDNTNAPYNIGGITRAGEVWRLLNKAAAPGRDRLNVTQGSGTTGLDLVTTYESAPRIYRLFSANDASGVDLTIDLSAWNLPSGQRVLVEEVSDTLAGGVRLLLTLSNNQVSPGVQVTNSVWLLTVPAQPQSPPLTLLATNDAMVQDGANKTINFGSSNVCLVRNNSTNANGRSVAFLKYRLPVIYKPDIQFALLTVRAASINGSSNVQVHAYHLANNNWASGTLTWSNAPGLAQNVAPGSNYTNNFLVGAGDTVRMAGEIVADGTLTDRTIDVTDFVRAAPAADISFLLAREVRFLGDVDNEGLSIVSREGDASNGPRLTLVRNKDSDNDGLSDEAETTIFGTNPTLADTDNDGVNDGQEILVDGTNAGTSTNVAPYILSQPASQSVQVGDTVALNVNAGGTPPLRYQWYFNITNAVAAQTNSILSLTNAQLSQAGNYRVVITNQSGSITSATAMLVVTNPAPPNAPSLPVHDPFNYMAGTELLGQGGWLLNSGTSGTVEAGNLDAPGLVSSAGNRLTWTGASMSLRLPFGVTLTAGEIYFSFAMRVDNLGGSFLSDGTLAGFTTGTGTSFGSKINIRQNGAGGFNLGISKGGGTTFGDWASTNFSVGETIFVVGRYRFNSGSSTDDVCDLWLNPAPTSFGLATPPGATIAAIGNGGTDLAQIDRVFFRSGGSSSSPAKLVADELRVGLSWAAVTPAVRPALRIEVVGGTATLFWPTNPPGFSVEQTTTIAPSQWSALNAPVGTSGSNYFSTVSVTNASQYFRLKR